MASSNCQACRGKMAQHRLWARHEFYRTGRLQKLAHARESLVGVELVLEHENFCLRAGLSLGVAPFLKWGLGIKWPPSQNGYIIVLSHIIESVENDFFFFPSVLGTQLRALHFPGKRSSTELNPQPRKNDYCDHMQSNEYYWRPRIHSIL
jgi:hypothetical protein